MQTDLKGGLGPVTADDQDGRKKSSLHEGGTEQIYRRCAEALEARRAFYLVARSLPAAVHLRESLAPSREFDEAGLPITRPLDGQVALYRAAAPPPRRRALLQAFSEGQIIGLILTPEDLAAEGLLEDLAEAPKALWLVQDAHCMSLESARYVPSLRRLKQVYEQGLADALELFTASMSPNALEDLRQLFQLDESCVYRTPVSFPDSVRLQFVHEPGALQDRAVLNAGLKRCLPDDPGFRGILVADLSSSVSEEALPASELASVAEEIGATPVTDPQIGADLEAETWAALLRHPRGILLTEKPEALQSLPSGAPCLLLRLTQPDSPSTVMDECSSLAFRGGGYWTYLGPARTHKPMAIDRQMVETIGRHLAEVCGPATGPVPVDAEELAKILGIPLQPDLETFGKTLRYVLDILVGADLLKVAREAWFRLEVADPRRFRAPHIDRDPRYVELSRKYAEALGRMGMLQSVQYRLEARPPKDLRFMSGFLEYSVGRLNVLFQDLANEGIIMCHHSASGSKGNRNFEVEGAGDRDFMLARLPAALDAFSRREALVRENAVKMAQLIEQEQSSAAALLEALGCALPPGQTAAPEREPKIADAVSDTQLPETQPTSVTPGASPFMPALEEAGVAFVEGAVDTVAVGAGGTAPEEAGRSKALEALDRLLVDEPHTVGAEQLSALRAWAEAIVGAEDVEAVLRRLDEAIEARPDSAWLSTIRVMALERGEDGDAAARALLNWLGSAPEPLREPLLRPLLSGVDYHFEADGPLSTLGAPDAVQRLGLILPVVELLAPEEALEIIRRSGYQGEVFLGELGVVKLKLEEKDIVLHRHGANPETEAQLWLAVDDLKSPSIEPEVVRARLCEAFLMVDGLVDADLSSRLAERVLAGEAAAYMSEARWILARSRILLSRGDGEATLAALSTLPADASGVGAEAIGLRVNALVSTGSPADALQVLVDSGIKPKGADGHDLWRRVRTGLLDICGGNESCERCALLEGAFCPSADSFMDFLEQNPFGESPKALRLRLEKRGKHGLRVVSARALGHIYERFGRKWDAELIEAWMDGIEEDRPDSWLTLARYLLQDGMPGLAEKAAAHVDAGTADNRIRLRLARIHLGTGDLAGSLELARQVAEVGGRSWSPAVYSQQLGDALGEKWLEEVDSLCESLPESAATFLRALALQRREQADLIRTRENLEAVLQNGPWRELRGAIADYRAKLGEDQDQDPLLTTALARLASRQRRVESRVSQLVASNMLPQAQRAELSRLAREASSHGMDEVAASAREALSAMAAHPSEARIEGGDAGSERGPERPRREYKGTSSGEQQGERRIDSDAGTGGERPASRRGGQGSRGRGRTSPSATESPRRAEDGRQTASVPPRRRTFENDGELLQALSEAPDDRERVGMVMPSLSTLLKTEPDRGMKLLRDAFPNFKYEDALDRPLSRLIRDGLPGDEHLPRLRRILERYHKGKNLNASLSEIGSREHPEPWKAVLGQLKLKS